MDKENILRDSFKILRDRRKVKLVDLARLCNLSHSSISKWLGGHSDLSSDTVSALIYACEELSPGSLVEFSLLISVGGLQDLNQFGDLLHLLAAEFGRLKNDSERLQRVS